MMQFLIFIATDHAIICAEFCCYAERPVWGRMYTTHKFQTIALRHGTLKPHVPKSGMLK